MMHSFTKWLFDPYAWNDALVLCAVTAALMFIYIIRESQKQTKKATK